MLGMMNACSDDVDVYGAKEEGRIRKQESIDQTKAFSEVKKKQAVTYTQDGDVLVDGKLVQKPDGVQLWESLIKQEAMTCLMEEGEEGEDAEKADESTVDSKEAEGHRKEPQ